MFEAMPFPAPNSKCSLPRASVWIFWKSASESFLRCRSRSHGISVSKTSSILGLKVDVDALPNQVVQQIRRGTADLDSPATTLLLLRANPVVRHLGYRPRSRQAYVAPL